MSSVAWPLIRRIALGAFDEVVDAPNAGTRYGWIPGVVRLWDH